MNLFEIILIVFCVYFAWIKGPGILFIIGPICFLIWIIVKKYPSFMAYRAAMAYKNGNLDKSIKLYRKTASLPYSTNYMKLTYAYLLLKANKVKEAKSIAKKVELQKDYKKDEIYLYAIYALAKYLSDDLDGAIELLEKAHKKDLKNTTTFGSLGHFYNQKGDMEKALKFNRKAYSYNDNDVVIMDNLFETYLRLSDFEKAESFHKKVMAKEPAFPEAYYHATELFIHHNELEKASEMLNKGLTMTFTALSGVKKEQFETLLESIRTVNNENE